MTTVDFEPLTVAVPLWEYPPGVFRVGKSRVLLELVLRAFQRGESPEGDHVAATGRCARGDV